MSNETKVLLVDDEPSCHAIVAAALNRDFYLEGAFSLAEANAKLAERNYEIIVLDIHLPDGNGISFYEDLCKRDVEFRTVIFLTKEGSISSKLRGFELGACDYIPKPFDPRELSARIKMHQRRESKILKKDEIIEMRDLKINRSCHEVRVGNELIRLTPLEYRLLLCLADAKGRVLSRQDLVSKVWNKSFLGDRTVDRHVSTLRSKLLHSHELLQTVQGEGYQLTKGG